MISVCVCVCVLMYFVSKEVFINFFFSISVDKSRDCGKITNSVKFVNGGLSLPFSFVVF